MTERVGRRGHDAPTEILEEATMGPPNALSLDVSPMFRSQIDGGCLFYGDEGLGIGLVDQVGHRPHLFPGDDTEGDPHLAGPTVTVEHRRTVALFPEQRGEPGRCGRGHHPDQGLTQCEPLLDHRACVCAGSEAEGERDHSRRVIETRQNPRDGDDPDQCLEKAQKRRRPLAAPG